MMAGGRPTDYRPEYCDMLVRHMKTGLSYETFAATLDLCRATLYVWEKQYPEFLDAKKRGFEASQAFWEKEGMRGMWNDKDGPVLNTGLWIFNMKNRFKWTDRVSVSPIVSEGERDLIEASDEELDKLIEGE